MRMLDAFWRAAAYCLHWRVIAYSFLPLLLAGSAVAALGWWYWEPAVQGLRDVLQRWALLDAFLKWLEAVGGVSFRAVLAPVLVVALALPVIVLVTALLVAWFMAPALVRLVAQRRFATLHPQAPAGSFWQGFAWALACTAIALLALVLSLPLWLLPPLALVLPPLVWAWWVAQVLAWKALGQHASLMERRELLARHRWSLMAMGLVCGSLAVLPAGLWAMGAVSFIFAPWLALLSVWLYTLLFAFSALWFNHYLLEKLADVRPVPGAPATPALDTTE